MELEKFIAGRIEKGTGYKYFVPVGINEQWIWKNPTINKLLEKAAVKIGELNSFANLVPNVDLFIQVHVSKEAVVSSKIEGTQTNIQEAMLPEEEISPERVNDWREVRNYIDGMNNAIHELNELPISSRLLKKTHKILLNSVRGAQKMPGQFRTSQNWIGGNSISDAIFIPPSHQYVDPLMGDLENFLHNEEIDVPGLIRIAIAHYQFETIHPFLDGNGRIGRLLITLYLVSEGILDKPLLYLSVFFEKNKNLYYDNLTRVREKNDMIQWLKYFLVGVEETASQAVKTLGEILELKENTEKKIQQNFGKRAHSAFLLLNELFKKPVTDVKRTQATCSLSPKAANDLIAKMEDHGILKEVTGQNRNRLFMFQDYLDVIKS